MPRPSREFEDQLYEMAMESIHGVDFSEENEAFFLSGYDSEMGLLVQVSQKPPYTYAGMTYASAFSIGFSKCNPIDTWSSEHGIKAAVRRAARTMARNVSPV